MPVYQPNAIVGNSRVLVSVGASGELMTFLYPYIDFAQNLSEGMPAVYFPKGDGSTGSLDWTFEPAWKSSQSYLDRTNILETSLRHEPTGLTLSITDFVHASEPLLLRRFEARNPTARPIAAKLFQYLDLQVGGAEHRNAVHYHPDRRLAVAYWRNICLAIGVDSLDQYGCGRATPGSPNSAKRQMERGRLNQQPEEIGDIDLAMGWSLDLAPGSSVTRHFIIAADSNEQSVVARVEEARRKGWDTLRSETRERCEKYTARARPVHIERDLEDGYYRCLLALDLLADAQSGSVLAAPEFDPFFERSGGYGYCWPRDAVEVCLALRAAGYPRYLGRFLTWSRRAQRPEGYWEQRYWLSGERGPAWCTHVDSLQIDQTASVLFAMGQHGRELSGQARISFLEEMWESVHLAASYLTDSISPENDLHTGGFDLWETFRGTFTYSNAAISAALGEAAYLAGEGGRTEVARRWGEAADRTKRSVMSKLWLKKMFARGMNSNGDIDSAVDSSALGLVTPFHFLRLDDEDECEIVRNVVEEVSKALSTSRGGYGMALRRYEGDEYAGGGPSAVSTLWLARVLLHMGIAPKCSASDAAAYRERAVAAMRAALSSATSTGLIPEMMGPAPGSHWAVPHAWAMASFVMAALTLDQLSAEIKANV